MLRLPRVVLRALLLTPLLSACTMGVIPRDMPPPEPAPADPAAAPDATTPDATTPDATTPDATTPDASTPAAPVRYSLDGNRLELPGPIVFTGEALDPASDPALEHVRGYLAAKDYISLLRIEGHAADQAQSERRALAVARWLIAHGVDCKRLIAVGFGPTKPQADSRTVIELHNAQLRGRAIGGAPADGGGQLAAADLCQ